MYKKIYIVNSGTTYVDEMIKVLKEETKYEIVNIFCKKNFYERLFFAISRIFKIDFSRIWMKRTLNQMKELNQEESLIIIFDSGGGSKKISSIRSKFKKTKIVFWYWNKINSQDFDIVKLKSDIVISYDRIDSETYNIEFIPQFYWRKFKERQYYKNIYDIIFIGFDRGRLQILKEAENFFKKNNLKTYFYVIDEYNKNKDPFLKNKLLKYEEIIEKTKLSKVILEINQKNQTGLSLRALEATLLGKKLITNNSDIKNYDFYHPNNIQIIDEINDIELNFLKTPLNPEYLKLGKKYNVKNWLTKIIELTNLKS